MVTAGGNHSCAVDTNGTASCWGHNGAGQLGNGSYYPSHTPVQFNVSGAHVRSIAAGLNFTCALLTDGTVHCSGANSSGQLGPGHTSGSPTPLQVLISTSVPLTQITQIATGDAHACALRVDGAVFCWGADVASGGSQTSYAREVSGVVNTTTGVVARSIAANGNVSCAVKSDGKAACWGNASGGSLGNGTTNNSSSTPVSVVHTVYNSQTQMLESIPLDNVVSIGLGVSHACAVTADGYLHCWGDDGNGQLGNGSATGTLGAAYQVSLSTQVIATMGGYQHACALTQDGVYCWGSDGAGQIGNGSTTTGTQISPVAVPMPENSTWVANPAPYGLVINSASTFQRGRILDVGSNHACMVVPAGSVVNDGDVDTATGPASTRSTAARVACWGLNSEGQLGGGHPTADGGALPRVDQNRPRFVTSALSGAPVAVATGSRHSCALTAAGRVYCWGRGVEGQVGTALRTAADPYEVPTLVPGLYNVVSITAGYDHTCALLADGQARCWGHNNRYQLGRSDSASESAVPLVVQVQLSGSTFGTLGNLVAISAGNWHTCAVTASGQVYCWGTNHLGQCGRPDYDSQTHQVIGARRVFSGWSDSSHTGTELASTMVSVSVGRNHSCAVSFNGDSYCWGSNSNGGSAKLTA